MLRNVSAFSQMTHLAHLLGFQWIVHICYHNNKSNNLLSCPTESRLLPYITSRLVISKLFTLKAQFWDMLGSTGICMTYSSGISLSPRLWPWRCWQWRRQFLRRRPLCVPGLFWIGKWSTISRKIAATAAYFGYHLGVHNAIFIKFGRLREEIGPHQNPEYLLNHNTDGGNIGYNRIRQGGLSWLAHQEG